MSASRFLLALVPAGLVAFAVAAHAPRASAAEGDLATEAEDAARDAPGTDSPFVGRPTRSTRVFDGRLDAAGARVRIYTSDREPADVLADVVARATRRGFVESAAHGDRDAATASMSRGSLAVVVRVARRDGHTVASIVDVASTSGFTAPTPTPAPTQGGEAR